MVSTVARASEHYHKLRAGYLFPEIARRVAAFQQAHPDAPLIRLGIGDVTLPLVPAVVAALHSASDEMGSTEHFRGYGPERGYDFLLDAIREHDYAARGVTLEREEIFVSDGSKQDSGNIQEIFGVDCRIAVSDPVYPVYVDSNVMAGRTGECDEEGHYAGILYLPATEENGFVPDPPSKVVDLVYLCSPNNPTGSVATREQLTAWVTWARENGAVLVFDAAYDAFIRDADLPRSIYEIEGAKECAVEMRSFSKRAGFTGLRCAYTVIPKALAGTLKSGERTSFNALWERRQATKFNGVPYIVQRAAAAVFSPEGQQQTRAQIDYYMQNARLLHEGLAAAGFRVCGGENAPYVWLRTPRGLSSWETFERFLTDAHVVGTPGSGFGPAGEGYLRLSAFNSHENVTAALERIQKTFTR